MDANDFKRVFALAKDKEFSWLDIDCEALYGLYLSSFKRVSVPIRVAAAMVKYQCMYLNGEWDSVELDEMRKSFRLKVDLLD